MKLKVLRPVFLLVAVMALTMSGCSDFDEMKSKRSLIEAEKLIEQGDEQNAEQALTVLLAQYPNTHAGELAAKYLYRIKKQREFRERKEFAKILDSYQQVLNGYHAIYAEYPSSMDKLDESGYFFDSAYLDEITPEGYQVYLWLMDDGSGYRAWSVAGDKTQGYGVDNLGRKLIAFQRDLLLEQLKSDYQEQALSNKLILLQPH